MKLIIVLAAALLIATTGVAFGQQVSCLGTESGGVGGVLECGPRAYVYQANVLLPETQIYFPTHDPAVANYTNICAPAGWSFTIVTNTPGLQEWVPKTAHGIISPGPGASCPYLMYWTGPAMVGIFEVGFDHASPSHDTEWWLIDNGMTAAWTGPVGTGVGPVHGPLEAIEIPTLSEYGMILLGLLLVAGGALFLVRRRRTA